MTILKGANGPNYGIKSDNKGRLFAKSVTNSDQDESAVEGLTFNLNTDVLTLTTAAETPLFYLKNEGESRAFKIPRIFIVTLASTGGTGAVNARLIRNPAGGTLLTSTDIPLSNFNFGSGNTVSATAKLGGTGKTVTGGIDTNFRFLFTSTNQRNLVELETVVVPRGASIVLVLTPPTGNTSMVVQAGLNFMLAGEVV